MGANLQSSTLSKRIERWWDETQARPSRLRPSRLPVPLRILTVATWIGTTLVLILGFFTNVVEEREIDLLPGELQITFAPIWPFICGLAVGTGALATGFAYKATRTDAPRHHVVLALCTGVVVPLIPALILATSRSWVAAPVAVAWLIATVVVVLQVLVLRRAPQPWVALLIAALIGFTWIPLAYANIRLAAALGATNAPSINELLTLVVAEQPVGALVITISTSAIAVLTAVGVAQAAHGRSSRADVLHNRRLNWRWTALVCLCAIGILALEVSGVWGLSSGYLEGYWRLRGFWSWPHAVIVAAAIAYVAQRSWKEPLEQRGDVAATVVVGFAALAGQLLFIVVLAGFLVLGAVRGEMPMMTLPDRLDLVFTWVAVAALVPLALRASMRGTVGQAVARVGLLYLVPVFAPITVIRLGWDVPVTFWASPVQVVICLAAIACVGTVLGLLGRNTWLAPSVASRLAIIPVLIVAGTAWIPTALAQPLTPYIAVAAALITLLWSMPPVAADVNRHSGVVLTASAQLLVVAAIAAISSIRDELTPDDPTYALLWFSVPLSALLCARVTARRTAQETL
ncbi:hypothetical protein PDG61_29885 [Mycolicibacterium sp. BiH015]|uniref:hypothetical protein n=1 Tax=Mycolicibacterium sp. BiH015 TaxID=3018808 RepID=UPI0022E79875|nr:hypothetical protein [Mycolicibacterium sp. BiH015]MDA2895158.1 hypothetical protein [Mycolicibacterium sp. BiH015]